MTNFLFLFPDQLRRDWIGCAGEVPVRTPAIDALAERGLRFTRAYCTAPLCAPSRASLAAGVLPHKVGVRDNQQDCPLSCRTVYRLLRDVGYRVGAVGKTDLHKPSHDNGPDGWSPRMGKLGFTETCDSAGKWDAVNNGAEQPHDPYTRYLHEHDLMATHVEDYQRRRAERPKVAAWPSPLAREHYTDDFVGRSAVDMLERFPREAPWLLQVNFPSPHEPMDPPAELLERWDGVELPAPVDPADAMTADEHQAARRSYAAMIEGVDEWCGRLIDLVEARGELDRTLIVFASDHGEMLGDHGAWGKSSFLEPSVGVPLVMAGPHVVAEGDVTDALVELPDVAATFLHYAGIDVPGDWRARTLRPLLEGRTGSHREHCVSMLPGHRAIITRRHKLIERDSQPPQLYDMSIDGDERGNVADLYPDMVRSLSRQLFDEVL